MTDEQKMTAILSEIMKVNDPDCLRTIREAAKNRRNDLLTAATRAWRVGDEVQMLPEHQSRKPYNTVGKIKKINRKNIVVTFPGFPTYNVPRTMLQKV